MDWFPQEYAVQFNYVKAGVALTAAVLLIFHMLEIWSHMASGAQRARYIVLLSYALLITYSSYSLATSREPVKAANIFTLVITIGLLFTTIFSIRDWRHSRRP